jgi:outer membrane protein, heavy metal efflux system
LKNIHLIMWLALAGLAGCAHYQPRPLQTQSDLLDRVPHLVIQAQKMPLPELATHPFNPDDGLDMTEVAILAVVNNGDLKATRDERGLARAQLLAAGILPNPQFTGGLDFPLNSDPGGVMTAFNLGLNYDLKALITRNAVIDAARAHGLQVDLSVLWQEWQVVQQVRLLFLKNIMGEKKRPVLQSYQAFFADQYRRSQKALKEGNLTLETASNDLIAWQEATARLNVLEQEISKARHDLKALLGLAPTVPLKLTGAVDLPVPDPEKIETLLSQLPKRRPDLLALQAGYASQEQQVRQAILAQFPALNIGLTHARDTTGIYTAGFGITISLPIFDRNQGNIAIERATRQQLHDEYRARLNQAASQVTQAMAQWKLITEQYQSAQAILPELETSARRAQKALEAGNLDQPAYVRFITAFLNKRLEAMTLEQSLLEQRIVLQTLLGNEIPFSVSWSQIHFVERVDSK